LRVLLLAGDTRGQLARATSGARRGWLVAQAPA
jgi:hypothetical protein